jgi:hypothetical protein
MAESQKKRMLEAFEPMTVHQNGVAELLADAIELAAGAIDPQRPRLRDELLNKPAFDGNLGTECPDQSKIASLDKRGHRLCGGTDLVGLGPTGEGPPGTTGPMVGTELYLLDDGELVELSWVGRWKAEGGELVECLSVALAQVVTPAEVVAEWNVPTLLLGMSACFDYDQPPESDMATRLERFIALAQRAMAAYGAPDAE